jgi:predicted component of type VI protein secretion system
MNFLETAGEALIQREEGNRQIAAALADGFRKLKQSLVRHFSSIFNNVPDQYPLP